MSNNQQKRLAAERHNKKLEDDRQIVAYNKWLRENTQNQRLSVPVREYRKHRLLGLTRTHALMFAAVAMNSFNNL